MMLRNNETHAGKRRPLFETAAIARSRNDGMGWCDGMARTCAPLGVTMVVLVAVEQVTCCNCAARRNDEKRSRSGGNSMADMVVEVLWLQVVDD